MALVSKESLELLKEKVDLVEVVSSYLPMKRTGKTFKVCCPFHHEKTPSFVLERGDTHYHCYGCGAHGDAIGFLVAYLKVSFTDAVKMLAEKFGVSLQMQDGAEKREDLGPLRTAMEEACRLFHFHLLHTEEGQEALRYLYARGIDLSFIHMFRVGLAPRDGRLLKGSPEVLQKVGLMREGGKPFFTERIMFPILDVQGNVIGFSGRKFLEQTGGGKYVNTPETPLFKKSRVLFGLYYSRKEIVRQRRALIVEGQIDALRLIQEGFSWTVAGQGTAFTEEHVEQLKKLGIQEAILAFDGDEAGQEAAVKVGNMFQKEGIEVHIVPFLKGDDPDAVLRREGVLGLVKRLRQASGYIPFLVEHLSKELDVNTPAGKNALVERVKGQFSVWKFPLMVYEAERKLAQALLVPETIVQQKRPQVTKRELKQVIYPDRIIESDLLRWLLFSKENYLPFVQRHVTPIDFIDSGTRTLYEHICAVGLPIDLLTLANVVEAEVLDLITKKRIQIDKGEKGVRESLQKILERNWLQQRDALQKKIRTSAQEEAMVLVQEFERLKRPEVQ